MHYQNLEKLKRLKLFGLAPFSWRGSVLGQCN